jgi:hypothetical protein
MALGSTEPLIEMTTRNLPGDKRRPARKADLTAICEPRKRGSFDVSQPCHPPRSLTGIASPLLCHEDIIWGSEGIAPPFLTWALAGGEWSLYPRGSRPQYPLYNRLGGPQSRSGRCGEKKILPCWWLNPGRPARRYTDWAIPTHHVWQINKIVGETSSSSLIQVICMVTTVFEVLWSRHFQDSKPFNL